MFCALRLVFGGTECVGSHFHVLPARTRFRRYRRRRVSFSCFRYRTHFRWCGVCRVSFSCFALSDSFSSVPRASGHVFIFCVPALIFYGTEGVGSRFHVSCSQTYFRWYRGRLLPFSSFTLPNSFSAVSRASGPVFMFCAPELVFGGTDGVRSRFHVLRSRTRFRWCGGSLVLFSSFCFPDSFSAVPWALTTVSMFYAPELVYGGTDGVGSNFHVLLSPTHFRRCGGRQIMFACFAVPWLVFGGSEVVGSCIHDFMFFFRRLVFGGVVGVDSSFHVLRAHTRYRHYRGRRVPFSCFASRTRFRRYRGRLLQFSCFTLPDSFSAVLRASVPVFMFCAPELVFGGTDDVRFRFHVLRSRTHFRRCERRRVPFSYFALRTQFNILRARTRFRRYRWRHVPFLYFALPTRFQRCEERQVPFSCLALLDLFSAVPRASSPVFMFCFPGLVFIGTVGVGSRFQVLRTRTRLRRYRRRRVPFSCITLPDTFSAVRRASDPVFMFCAPGLIFGGSEGVMSRFHVLRSRTGFRQSRGRLLPFTCFKLLDSFLAVSRASGPIFMLCAPELVCGGTDGVGCRFHVLRTKTCFRQCGGRPILFSCFALSD
jgi:hypothetical protein